LVELKKFDLEHVLPMHCSSQTFIDLAKQEMHDKLVLCITAAASPHDITRNSPFGTDAAAPLGRGCDGHR
jgi:hypothetical protein